MSKASDLSRLEFILEMIDDIGFAVASKASVADALQDRICKPAILMSLLQIGETLNKIEDEALRAKLPVKGAYDVRNFIAHDYEGVDLALVEHIIRELVPKLQSSIRTILAKF